MKVDEVIIKLCSERGYDPSQINDYYTLLEQLECIKKLLETYPNQQYFTVKAYTYTASTKMYSFKISDVNNYGRQINVGDILIVSLANGILELAQISALDTTAGTGEAIDVGQLTGKNGIDGKGIENVDKVEIAEGNSVVSVENGFQVDISAQFKDIAGDLLTNATGYITLPIKGGNGITVDVSSDNKAVEIRFADKVEINQTPFLFYDENNEVGIMKVDGTGVEFDPDEDGNTQFKIAGQTGAQNKQSAYGSNIKCDEMAIGDSNDTFAFIPVNAYYEITNVPNTAVNGVFPYDNGWFMLRNHPEKIRILFNKEFYQVADKEHTTGTIVYSHVGYESNQLVVKTITITISTRAWILTTIKPYMYYGQGIIMVGDVSFETPVIAMPEPTWESYYGQFQEGAIFVNGVILYNSQKYVINRITFNAHFDNAGIPVFENGGTIFGYKVTDGSDFSLDLTNDELVRDEILVAKITR